MKTKIELDVKLWLPPNFLNSTYASGGTVAR